MRNEFCDFYASVHQFYNGNWILYKILNNIQWQVATANGVLDWANLLCNSSVWKTALLQVWRFGQFEFLNF